MTRESAPEPTHRADQTSRSSSRLGRAFMEEREAAALAPYAQRSAESRGRRHPEPEHAYRTGYQRDRDRVVHCTAFRRLEY